MYSPGFTGQSKSRILYYHILILLLQRNFSRRGITIASTVLSVHPSVQILFGPVLRIYTCQLFEIYRTDQSYMEPIHCNLYYGLLAFVLEIMTFTIKKPAVDRERRQIMQLWESGSNVRTKLIIIEKSRSIHS